MDHAFYFDDCGRIYDRGRSVLVCSGDFFFWLRRRLLDRAGVFAVTAVHNE